MLELGLKMSLPKKYVIVVGATGGIGKSITKSAIDAGFIVIATGTKQSELLKIKKQFGHDTVVTYKMDLEKYDSYKHFYKFVKNKAKNVEWLIHSAGYINKKESLLKFDWNIIKKTFLINSESIIGLTYRFLPIINKNGGIIMISSTASFFGNPQYPIYSASKGALNIFARSLARNMAKSRQSSIIICPGATNTRMRQRIAKDANTKQNPEVIGETTSSILKRSKKYRNGDVITIQNNVIKIQSRLKF